MIWCCKEVGKNRIISKTIFSKYAIDFYELTSTYYKKVEIMLKQWIL